MFTLKYFVNIRLLLCQCGAFLAEKFLCLMAELLVMNQRENIGHTVAECSALSHLLKVALSPYSASRGPR